VFVVSLLHPKAWFQKKHWTCMLNFRVWKGKNGVEGEKEYEWMRTSIISDFPYGMVNLWLRLKGLWKWVMEFLFVVWRREGENKRGMFCFFAEKNEWKKWMNELCYLCLNRNHKKWGKWSKGGGSWEEELVEKNILIPHLSLVDTKVELGWSSN
jgi:hypothetical protein